MYVFNVYVWGPHGEWAMLSGLVHTCMYVFNFYWFCTFLYIPVPSLNKDFIINIIIMLFNWYFLRLEAVSRRRDSNNVSLCLIRLKSGIYCADKITAAGA